MAAECDHHEKDTRARSPARSRQADSTSLTVAVIAAVHLSGYARTISVSGIGKDIGNDSGAGETSEASGKGSRYSVGFTGQLSVDAGERVIRVRILSWLFALGLILPVAAQPETADLVSAEAEVELQLRNVITSWASAWQSGMDDIYLLHYHPDFRPEYLPSREEWIRQRQERLTTLGDISISLREFSLTDLDKNSAVVRFTLNYSRPGYADRTRKEMHLHLNGHLWQISREINLSVTRLQTTPGE